MELFSKKRRGIYIYFKHVRDIRKLEKYGNVIAVSRKNRYIYIYNYEDQINKIITELKKKKYVKQIILSELADMSLSLIQNNFNKLENCGDIS